ncbi:zinc finger BED domain-containing protein RICESLEEPER 1-like isoform X1 [Canna indica]|uniref:Zinc finger BED domain-containing protein RICESLEEPER 1-like isoform X1 n=1 Tax=Canna indica TaxID=4628 RepID=A0AAQ3JP67_9LILI|nr:zinc finger BED domain-containing protein RICESLEEPER 1-like isoform X1 [Canna indica]
MEANDNTAITVHNPRARKLRSLVWNDFTKERKADGTYVAICNHCKKQLTASSRSGTTHLKNHLVICTSTKRVKRKKLVVRRLVLKSNDAKNEGAVGSEHTQFDQESSRQDLARMVILHGYPFNIVHHTGFRTFVRNLQPLFKLVSADAVKADCMKIYESERLRLHEMLEKLHSRVSLTVDMWRSMMDVDYVCLTCHYIDNDWRLQKKIINFFHIGPPGTDQEISKTILDRLQEWNIDGKLCSVVLDNCITNDLVASELLGSLRTKGFLMSNGDLFYARTCGHLLNLVVHKSLETVGELTDRVRASVQYVKSSQERLSRFQKDAEEMGIPLKPLVLDAPANWPSTYIMLETACQYQEAFKHLAESDVENTGFLSLKDWTDVRALVECLEVLYHALDKFSSTRIPTANLYFNDMCGIHLLFKTWYKSPQPFVASMAKEMLEKFEQYWDLTRMLMAISSVLDPRYKMKSVEYFFKQIYDDAYEAKTRIDNVRDSFINLYNEYVGQSANSSKYQAFYTGNSSGYNGAEYVNGGECKTSRITLSDTQRGLDQYLKETSSGHPARSDLDMYLEEAVHPSKGLDDNFDILAWWKYNAAKYPALSMMARDILGIPISVVPLDSEARTLNQYLSSTDPVTVECLICAQDWIGDETEVSPVDALAIVSSSANMEGNGDECMVPAGGD